MSAAIYVEDSKNSKLSNGDKKIDCTYSPIKNTCSSTCKLKDSGCYAMTGYVGIVNARLQNNAEGFSPLQVARQEAKAIRNSYSGKEVPANRDLRLHVSGDSKTIKGSRVINQAVKSWLKRGGNKVYSYTHSWRHVPRKEWSAVSMLASIDSIEEAKQAREQGYAPALVVAEHSSDKAYYIKGSNVKWIPCPSQTRQVACVDCRLCMDADGLFKRNAGITFAVHGAGAAKVKRRLTVIK